MKLVHKITTAFAVIVLSIIITGIFNYYKLNSLVKANDAIEHGSLPTVSSIAKLKYLVSSVRRLESQMIIASGDERQSLMSRSKQLQKDSLLAIAEIKRHVYDDGDDTTKKHLALLDVIEKETKAYFLLIVKLLK
jgi:H2-forming N5,N10-methylenetetrahydromethanopterin dehydrogenase-like enzyme